MTDNEFIKKILPVALEGFRKFNILPSLTIAQTCLESSYGKKHMGWANNYFGIKAGNGWVGGVVTLPTKEWDGEKMIDMVSRFRAYQTTHDSVRDYHKLLSGTSRYKKVLKCVDYKTACHEVWKAGYATDPDYPEKLIRIIENYGLNKYDEQEPVEMPETKAWEIIQSKTGVSDRTMNYMANDYKYGKELILKLANAIK